MSRANVPRRRDLRPTKQGAGKKPRPPGADEAQPRVTVTEIRNWRGYTYAVELGETDGEAARA